MKTSEAPKNPTFVAFASDWERDLWRDVYMATLGTCLDNQRQAEYAADGAVEKVQARTAPAQRPALDRLAARMMTELGNARTHGLVGDSRLTRNESEIARMVSENAWRAAIAMVREAIGEETE